jgi:hypothetical protein
MVASEYPPRLPRYRVSLFVGSAEQDTVPFGRARNLSGSGIFLETAVRPEIGSTRELVFIWGDDTLTCKAKIVRHAADGIGLTFVDPDAGFLRASQEILDSSPPVEVLSSQKS